MWHKSDNCEGHAASDKVHERSLRINRDCMAWQDLMKIDRERARDIRVTIVEGMQLLGSFDVRLREYAANKLHKQGRPPGQGGSCSHTIIQASESTRGGS